MMATPSVTRPVVVARLVNFLNILDSWVSDWLVFIPGCEQTQSENVTQQHNVTAKPTGYGNIDKAFDQYLHDYSAYKAEQEIINEIIKQHLSKDERNLDWLNTYI
jgi:hypothetical protein